MMLLLIMILFFVCWTPLLLFNMLAAFDVIDPTLTQGDFFYICFFLQGGRSALRLQDSYTRKMLRMKPMKLQMQFSVACEPLY